MGQNRYWELKRPIKVTDWSYWCKKTVCVTNGKVPLKPLSIVI